MARITRIPFARHLRSSATMHVRHQRRGRVVREGVGLSFWYRPLSAVLSEVPVDDREVPLLFHARTADFQDVTVQASITYRVADPALAVTRIDFGIDSERGSWWGTPLEQLGGLLTELAQQHALDLLARTPLARALADGVPALRERITAGLGEDPRLVETGVTVVSVRVVAVRPEPDVEKALQTPARELVRQEADRATYERRALAVERERAISENELQSKIELARREEQLIQQRNANGHRQAPGEAEAERIRVAGEAARETLLAEAKVERGRLAVEGRAAEERVLAAAAAERERLTSEAEQIRIAGEVERATVITEAKAAEERVLAAANAERERLLGEARADAARALGLADGAAEAAKLDAWRDLAPAVVYGLALRELAAKLPGIGTLNLTPDLLTQALTQLTGSNGSNGQDAGAARR